MPQVFGVQQLLTSNTIYNRNAPNQWNQKSEAQRLEDRLDRISTYREVSNLNLLAVVGEEKHDVLIRDLVRMHHDRLHQGDSIEADAISIKWWRLSELFILGFIYS